MAKFSVLIEEEEHVPENIDLYVDFSEEDMEKYIKPILTIVQLVLTMISIITILDNVEYYINLSLLLYYYIYTLIIIYINI